MSRPMHRCHVLRTLFPQTHRAYAESRGGVELDAFAHWLITQGYSRLSTRGHLRCLRSILERRRVASPRTRYTAPQLHAMFTPACTSATRTLCFRGTERAY